MKKNLLFGAAIAAAILTGFSSCDKDDEVVEQQIIDENNVVDDEGRTSEQPF